jgi:hypothetical protein
LKILGIAQSALGNGNNVIDLKQEVWLGGYRDTTLQAGVIVAVLDLSAEPGGHECSLTGR